MTNRNSPMLLAFCAVLAFSGCSLFEDPYVASGTVGGAVGAGIGAGTGALIARNMVNGDIAESALIGGAIGLPVGILAGVAYRSYQEQSEVDDNSQMIRENYEYITRRQYEIDRTREAIVEDSFAIEPDKSLRTYIYTGPSIGTYGRP